MIHRREQTEHNSPEIAKSPIKQKQTFDNFFLELKSSF